MLKIFEVIIAIVSISIIFILTYKSIDLPSFETINWKIVGFNALKAIDDNGFLAKYAIDNDISNLNNFLKPLLPLGINHDIVICFDLSSCNKPNISSTKIITVDYYIAGNATLFAPRKIILYMWS
jgi:hypothetical protein